MPNTLAHIGIQSPLTRFIGKPVPMPWIALGCIIPDIPWILQRIILLLPFIDPVTLRIYVSSQASLFFCCLFSLALSLFTRRPLRIFAALSVNCLLHLLLDACQIKWGNGVHLLVPFSWHTTNFALLWPEHLVTVVFTLLGMALLTYSLVTKEPSKLLLQRPTINTTILQLLFLTMYMILPVFLIQSAYNADIHYSKTILDVDKQKGKKIELDRGVYNRKTKTIKTYAGPSLVITNPPPTTSTLLSIRGRFTAENSVTLLEYHEHKKYRDYASYLGLLFTLLLWGRSILQKKRSAMPISMTDL